MEKVKSLLSEIKEALISIQAVAGVVLCGTSNVSDNFHLDLFILTLNPNENGEIDYKIKQFEQYSIKTVVKTLDEIEKIDTKILQDLFRGGKIIYWNSTLDISASHIFKLKPYTLFTFELTGMTQVAKVQFNYQLYGKKDSGQLQAWEGVRVAKSCFYVPHLNKYKVTRFFSKFNIKNSNIDIWI